MRERTTKRKLPFTVGANGEQKDSDTGTSPRLPLAVAWFPLAVEPDQSIPGYAQWGRDWLLDTASSSTLGQLEVRG